MRTLFLSALALGSLLALLVLLRPHPAATSPAAHAAAAPAVKTFDLVVRDQRRVSGEPVLKVAQGDRVVLTITTDRPDQLHLHGYDLSLDLNPGVAGTLRFIADRSGRFDFELHRSHLELGALEVSPR